MTSSLLGLWAVIDIETTGADPGSDQIIDVGFLQFDGVELIRQYRSLVRFDGQLSHFIQKLTGITPEMLLKAPRWQDVLTEVQSLHGHYLIAHNSDFEESFLSSSFRSIDKHAAVRESYQDSILYLSLLFPHLSSLKLERFIVDFGLADGEVHRGFEDSLDLLKVMIVATLLVHQDREHTQHLEALFLKYQFSNFWFEQFFMLTDQQLKHLASQIDFDWQAHVEIAKKLVGDHQEIEHYQPSPFPLQFSGSAITEILKDQQTIARFLPHYQFRQSQLDLSLRVGQSFKNSVHALVQAPTGTGKTLGYLLPSALYALSENRQVLVATGTKTLQEQAMSKDIPQLRKILGLDQTSLKIVRMLGSSNHLCELLFRHRTNESSFMAQTLPFDEAFSEVYFERLFFHNARVPQAKKVVRDDLPFVLKMKLKIFKEMEKSCAVDFRSCTGFKCPYREECSYFSGINQAKEANIIVGNHALMFTWPRAFPRPSHIIVDEAHKIEGEATDAFSLQVEQDDLLSLAKNLQHNQGLGSLYYLIDQDQEITSPQAEIASIKDEANRTFVMLQDHLITLPEMVETFFKRRPYYTEQFSNESPMLYPEETSEALALSIYNGLASIRNILDAFFVVIEKYCARWDIKNLKEDHRVMALTRFQTFSDQLDDIRLALGVLIERKSGYSHALRYQESSGFAVLSAPIDIGRVVHQGLLETSSSVVFTSATLANAQGDQGSRGMEWSLGHLYLAPEKRFKSGFYLPAVYDYQHKAQVHLCDDTPELNSPEFVSTVLPPVMKLIEDIGGRSLLLFSARSRFEVARELLLARFDGVLPLYIQGMGNNVVEEFKKTGGILLGMESFGEGIDIPGDALRFVFIDKIPDLRRELVIDDRRDFFEKNIGNEFTDYFLAHRTRSLHQKLGRLLRTVEDYGGAIVVDSRVKKWKGPTMAKLIKLMEPYQLKRSSLNSALDGVRHFILEQQGK